MLSAGACASHAGAAAAGLVGRGLRRARRGWAAARAEAAGSGAGGGAGGSQAARAAGRRQGACEGLRIGCVAAAATSGAAARGGGPAWVVRDPRPGGCRPVRGAGARGRGCGCGVRGTAALLPSTVLCGAAGAAQRRRWQRRRRGRPSGCRRARPGCSAGARQWHAHENYAMWMSSCEVRT